MYPIGKLPLSVWRNIICSTDFIFAVELYGVPFPFLWASAITLFMTIAHARAFLELFLLRCCEQVALDHFCVLVLVNILGVVDPSILALFISLVVTFRSSKAAITASGSEVCSPLFLKLLFRAVCFIVFSPRILCLEEALSNSLEDDRPSTADAFSASQRFANSFAA